MTDQAKRLQEQRDRTLAELECQRRYLRTGLGQVADGSADSVDIAADIYEREKTLAIIQTLEKKLVSIERALRAAEGGNYGICEVCGQAIGLGRLDVMPYTTTCIKCQAKLERLQPRRLPATVPPGEE